MTHIYIFNFFLAVVSLYAFLAGGMPERAVATVFLTAAAASFIVLRSHSLAFDTNLMLIDIVVFACLTGIAARANRFWPLYEASLQLLTVGVHGVKLYNPSLADWMWAGASAKLAYPTLILLAIGVMRHRRRVAAYGSEISWSLPHPPPGMATYRR